MAFIRATVDTGGGAKRLEEFGKTIRNRVLRKAVNASTVPALKSVKATVPVGRGLLRKSQGRKVKTYSGSGVTVGIVGSRSNPRFQKTINPKRDTVLSTRKGVVTRKRIVTTVQDTRRYNFLVIRGSKRSKKNNYVDSGYQAALPQIRSEMTSKLEKESQAEARKLAAKTK